MSQFLKFNPPRFRGELDDRKAEAWLNKVEKIFRVLNYTTEQQVKYATFLLDDATITGGASSSKDGIGKKLSGRGKNLELSLRRSTFLW